MNGFNEKRGSGRHPHPSPIVFSFFNSKQFHPAISLNYSKEGIYFESDFAPPQRSSIFIKRENSEENEAESKFYDGYRTISVAEVKWCKKLPGRKSHRYGIGAGYYVAY